MFEAGLEETYIPDSTAIVEGLVRRLVKEGSLRGRVLIHFLLVNWFKRLAKEGHNLGFIGLQEVRRLREICAEMGVEFEYVREVPQGFRWVNDEDIDDVLRELAAEWSAVLITASEVQYKACEAIGIRVIYRVEETKLSKLAAMFDEQTMSVHLKEGVVPFAKKGFPGNWKFVQLRDEPMSKEEIEDIVREIFEEAKSGGNGFIELDRPGSMIIQLNEYRIVITRPPFSDGVEVTAVRPVARLKLEDYKLPKKLLRRLEMQAEGILIAGAPGMGKTTFAQALAEYYRRRGKIIKTIESPRDMQLPPDITQYSKNYATSEEIHDVLLLSRPDYTFFDEMRDTKDFELYADLRLAGVGMVGVVHATSPIDAIQRFIGRVELGMIPSIIDTVIYIKNGQINKVYELETVVKIPHGLKEADLARPVVVVRDYLTGEAEYELYVFGERTFVVPIKKKEKARREESSVARAIRNTLRKYLPDEEIDIEVTEEGRAIIYVSPEYMGVLLGKTRKRLLRVGRKMGFELEVRPKIG
ncbi:MAG: ATPase [Thermoprotei archaeon]|nr:MAG: ATPase [Thermoprotei archaeon]